MLTIGKLAKQARVTTDTIRFYERIALIAAASKTSSGYRLYTEDSIKRLRFIRHAQRCGFSLPEIRELLQAQPSDGVRAASCYQLARQKKNEIEQTIATLRAMSEALSSFVDGRGSTPVSEYYVASESPLVSAFTERMRQEHVSTLEPNFRFTARAAVRQSANRSADSPTPAPPIGSSPR